MKYIIPIIVMLLVGCKSDKLKNQHLLYIGEDYAYKSILKEDYIIREECYGKVEL